MNTSIFSNKNEEVKFPSCVFPETIRKVADEIAKSVNANEEFVYAPILLAHSTVIGSKVKAKIKLGWEEGAMVWLIIIGEPGSKKTPALNKALMPIFNLQKGFGKSVSEFLPEGEEFKHKILVVTDPTIESLSEVLLANKHGVLLYKDEAMGWIGGFNQYKSGKGNEKEQYLSIYSSQVIIITRKSKPVIQVDNPFVSFIGGIQVDRIEELANMKGDGFLDRILWVYPASVEIKHSEHELSEATYNEYEKIIHFIYFQQEKSEDRVVPFSAEAKAYWDAWHIDYCNSMNNDLPTHIISIMSKLEAYSIRLALILEFMFQAEKFENVEQISLKSVQGAIELVKYFLTQAEKTFSSVASSKLDKQVERAIVFFSKQKHATAVLRKIYTHKVGGVKDVHGANDLIAEMRLRGLGAITQVPDVMPGKQPTISFTLSPKFIIQKYVPKTENN
jgi:hypothetical protein